MTKAKKIVRREYTKDDVKALKAHSKARTPIAKISNISNSAAVCSGANNHAE